MMGTTTLWDLAAAPIPEKYLKKDTKGYNNYLTDIKAAYDWMMLTKLCGPFGHSDTWGRTYDVADMMLESGTSEKGKARTTCIIKKVRCWLCYGGTRYEADFPGSSENSNAGYAMKGALTSAFGQFFAHFGRGIEIYADQDDADIDDVGAPRSTQKADGELPRVSIEDIQALFAKANAKYGKEGESTLRNIMKHFGHTSTKELTKGDGGTYAEVLNKLNDENKDWVAGIVAEMGEKNA